MDSNRVGISAGDANFPRNWIQVSVEGATPVIFPSTGANEFAVVTISGGISANDELLTITIANTGGNPYWGLNGLDVWTGDNDPGVMNQLAEVWGERMVGEWLTDEALDVVVPLARAYWLATDLTAAQIAELHRTPIAIGDLATRKALGVTKPVGIWLDASGAGRGWAVGSGQVLGTGLPQRTTAGYDLLTVLSHEFGHVLGYDDLDSQRHPDHIMTDVLGPGMQRAEWVTVLPLACLSDLDAKRLPLTPDLDLSPSAQSFPSSVGREAMVDRVLEELLRDSRRVADDIWHRDEDLAILIIGQSDPHEDDCVARASIDRVTALLALLAHSAGTSSS